MRKKWFGIGCLTSVVVVVLVFFLAFVGIGKVAGKHFGNDKQKEIVENSFVHVVVSGNIEEHKEFDSSFFSKSEFSAFEIIAKIKAAQDDPKITGMILEPKYMQCGYATLNEIISSIRKFKESGKPVYAYLKTASDKQYYLAAIADKIYLNPSNSTGIVFSGIGINSLYYKNLLDKVGVEMKVIHAGKYKGAGENYTRNTMSIPVRESLDSLFEDYYAEIIYQIAKNRGIPERELKHIFEERENYFIRNKEALSLKLVDGLKQREQFLGNLSITEDNLVDLKNISPKKTIEKSAIAVVFAEGTLTGVKSEFASQNIISAKKYVKILQDIEADDKIKGVVIRVNSPGGSPLESDIINEQIKQLKLKKPVVISMGNVAASGGYFIASNANYIFADPMTITGSIGVVMMIPNLSGLGEKMGVNSETIEKGKFANFLNPWKEISPAHTQILKNEIEIVYADFKRVVSEGRKMDVKELEKYAQGRVWSAQQALKNKLIDEVGDLSVALKKVSELAQISPTDGFQTFPKKSSLYEMLMKDLSLDIKMSAFFETEYSKDLELRKIENLYRQIKEEPLQQRLLIDCEF